MNDTRNRDKPARELTKREELAMRIYAADKHITPPIALRQADDFFDELEHLPELAHAYDEPDFDHEGTP